MGHAISDSVLVRRSLGDQRRIAAFHEAYEYQDHAALRVLAAEPALREAIEVAAPELGAQLDRFLAGELDARRTRRLLRALVRYGARMQHRATPMGLFAAVGAVDVASADRPGPAVVHRSIRPSGSWCAELATSLGRHDDAVLDLRLTASRSVYPRRGALIALGAAVEQGVGGAVAVTAQLPLITTLLAWCDGWRPACAVVDLAAAESGAPVEDARRFVLGMVRGGLLVTELAEVATAVDPFGTLERITGSRGGWAGWADVARGLAGVRDALDTLPQRATVPVDGYRRLRRAMSAVHEPVDLHVDATLRNPTLPVPSATELGRALHPACRALALTSPASEHPVITAAARWFGDRFSDTHALRLAEMFLPGVGFDPRTADQHVPGGRPRPYAAAPASPLGPADLLASPSEIDVLARLDPAALRSAAAQLPAAFLALVEVSAVTNTPRPLHLRSLSAGLQLVGRFAHLDPAVAELARAFVRDQEDGEDVLRAEVRCPCLGRSQNIAHRPMLRRVCIDFGPPTTGLDELGRPVVSLPVADLVVRLVDGRLQVFSERLGRRVVPSVATAVVFHRCSYPAAAFLTLLAGQESAGRRWNWGELHTLPQLPRVVAGDVVLAPRKWTVTEADWDLRRGRPVAGSATAEDVVASRLVTVGSVDSPLLVDVRSAAGAEMLSDQLRKAGGRLVVHEAAPPPDGADPVLGAAATELVVPFRARVAAAPAAAAPRHRPPAPWGPVPRFGPGSRWASFKIYGRPERLDALLAALLPQIRAAADGGLLRRWFFLRYADPEQHVRLRFTGRPDRLWGRFVPGLWRLLREHELCWDRATVDEYRPEIDRYGGPRGLLFAEELFESTSELAIRLGHLPEADRLRCSALVLHRTLASLGFRDRDKRALLAAAEQARANRHRVAAARVDAGRRYRSEGDALHRCLAPGVRTEIDIAMPEWAERSAPAGHGLRTLLADDPSRLGSVTHSLLHMHCNRMFPVEPNYWEVVACSMLRRVYDRAAARGDAALAGARS